MYSSEVGTGLLLRGNNRGGGVCTVQRLEQDCCVEATKRGGGGVYGTKVGIRLLYRGYNRGGGGVLFVSEVREKLTTV